MGRFWGVCLGGSGCLGFSAEHSLRIRVRVRLVGEEQIKGKDMNKGKESKEKES